MTVSEKLSYLNSPLLIQKKNVDFKIAKKLIEKFCCFSKKNISAFNFIIKIFKNITIAISQSQSFNINDALIPLKLVLKHNFSKIENFNGFSNINFQLKSESNPKSMFLCAQPPTFRSLQLTFQPSLDHISEIKFSCYNSVSHRPTFYKDNCLQPMRKFKKKFQPTNHVIKWKKRTFSNLVSWILTFSDFKKILKSKAKKFH